MQVSVDHQVIKLMADWQQRQDNRDTGKKKAQWVMQASSIRTLMPTLALALTDGSLGFTSSRLSRTRAVMQFQRMVSSSADSPWENWRSCCQQLFTNLKTP